MQTLHELGLKYGTDKSHYHNYCNEYDKRLSHLRYEKVELLEIGIQHGSSLAMWHDYFTNPNSMIYGADILDKSMMNGGRIMTFQCDQEKEEDLRRLPKDMDIIIDDGGHDMIQQQITMRVLFKENLKPGGIFIMEDLSTSRPHHYERHRADAHNNTLNLIEDLIAGNPREGSTYFLSDEEFHELKDQIESIEIIDLATDSVTSLIIKKK